MQRIPIVMAAVLAAPLQVLAQTPTPAPNGTTSEPQSMLVFFILATLLVIAIAAWLWIVRRRSNPGPTSRPLDPNNPLNRR